MKTIGDRMRDLPRGIELVFLKPNGRKFHLIDSYMPGSEEHGWLGTVKSRCMSEWDDQIKVETILEWREIPQSELADSPIVCKTCLRR